METIPQLPPEQAEVVAWLRTAEGIIWSLDRIGWGGRIRRHRGDSGVFAEILDDRSLICGATWCPDDGVRVGGVV